MIEYNETPAISVEHGEEFDRKWANRIQAHFVASEWPFKNGKHETRRAKKCNQYSCRQAKNVGQAIGPKTSSYAYFYAWFVELRKSAHKNIENYTHLQSFMNAWC